MATVQAELSEEGISLLSDSQRSEMLNGLYQHASESGVNIADLHRLSLEERDEGVYEIEAVGLQAEGAIYGLVDFASRIRGGIAVESMTITENILTMEITIYTSPYVSGDVTPATYGASQVAEALTSINSYDPDNLALVDLRYDNRRFTLEVKAIDPDIVVTYAHALTESQSFSSVEVQSMSSIAESEWGETLEAVIVLELSRLRTQ